MNHETKGKQTAAAKLQDIQKLVEMLDRSGLDELELEVEGMRLRLLKHRNPVYASPASPQPPVYMMAPNLPTSAAPQSQPVSVDSPKHAAAAKVSPPADAALAPARSSDSFMELKSPMVGTFYRAPAPGAEPFVKVGDKVRKGQTLCIIEAMKLMNEIECEAAGTVVDILIDNAQAVEYGEVLMHIEPAG